MLTPSITAAGCTILRKIDVSSNLREALAASEHYGSEVETGPDSPLGQLIDPFAEDLGQAYEQIADIYNADNPDSAEGVPLDNLAGVTLAQREPATYSRVTLTLTGTPATVVPAGKRAGITGGTAWALDDDCIIGAGPTAAFATCTTLGLQTAEIGAISQILDPVTGWSAVTNAAVVDSTTTAGHEIEGDGQLQARREESLALAGSSTDPATQARITADASVTAVAVRSNRTDEDLSDGQPPASLAIFVWPVPLDLDSFAALIYGSFGAPGGIRLWGSVTREIRDAQGYLTEVSWSPATELVLHWAAIVTPNTEGSPYPADGDDQVEAAILAYSEAALGLGIDVLPDLAKGYILMGWTDADDVRHAGVPGIRSLILQVKVGSAPSGGDTVPITVDMDEIATTIAGNIGVTS